MTDTRLAAALPPLPTLPNTNSLPRSNVAGSSSVSEEFARAQANEFEASFLAALLKPVFEGLARDRTFGGGFAEETWTGLLTQEYANGIAGQANLGIADQVYERLIRLQETTDPVNGASAAAPQSHITE